MRLVDCFLGGRGQTEIKTEVHGNFHQAYGGLQEAVITRHSCYGVHAAERSTVHLHGCTFQYISEAVVLLRQHATVDLSRCVVCDSPIAFLAGEDDGEELRVSGSSLHVRSLWFDEDRPRKLRISESTITFGEVNLDLLALRQNQGRVLDEDLPEIELEDYRATNVF